MKKKKLPFLISESIFLGDKKKNIFKDSSQEVSFGANFFGQLNLRRINLIRFLIFVMLFVFLTRLFWLTIVDGEKNRILADNNRIKLVNVEAKRGRILDRNGKVLAYSEEKVFLNKDNSKTQISSEQAAQLQKEGLAGEDFIGPLGRLSKETVRVYPYGEVMAHAIGYTSIVQEEDAIDNPNITEGEFVGRLGVEQTYDSVLRGVDGRKIVEVDANGKVISILGEVESKSGQDITLTVDVDLQKKAFDVMNAALGKVGEKAGALIICDAQSGEVLALLSFPAFDPSDVGKFITREEKPLFNRAIAGTYAPGSVFKIVTSIAGLESRKINEDTQIEDVGAFELGGVKFSNWFYTTYGGKDGFLKIDRAIARSNDIFFFRLGQQLALGDIRKWAIAAGFGQKTGIDLPGESFGLVPDEQWKQTNLQESWFLGDTMHLAIGQGFMVATPLQINVMTDYIANGGRRIVPHLVSKVAVGGDGKQIFVNSTGANNLVPSEQNLQLVRLGMRQACQQKGTAYPFFSVKYAIFCKTGTAEKSQGNPHAWFTAYAPDTLPQAAITVMIENGGEGSAVAAPVAKEVLDWYFLKR